jgi:hypothetical protein
MRRRHHSEHLGLRVEWIGEPGVAIGTFHSLDSAIDYVTALPLDQQHVIVWGSTVVWPDNVRRELR